MVTKKDRSKKTDELRKEYDVSKLANPVRGKYQRRAAEGSNLVLLDPDVALAFPSAEAVNEALRMLVTVAQAKVGAVKKKKRPA